jgi:feruloyl esterase
MMPYESTVRLLVLSSALILVGRASAAGPVELPVVAPVQACEALAKADLRNVADTPTTITAVKKVDSKVGAFCRVLGSIKPSIDFEVDLPIAGWQQRYLQTGCGGLCGVLNVQVSHAGTCAPALQGGLAVASDDMGHQSPMGDGSFGTDPQKRIDFAYRANHVTALVAKALIKAYYGQAPRYSYFSGCSDGGREALVEAERFPDDFNGIAAGAPAMNFQVQNSFYHAWQYRSNTGPDGKHILLASKLPVLHRAALAACDALDGLKDGLISDPRACHFDPAIAQCPAGAADTHDCLTAAEVAVARKLYAGPTDEAGHHLTIGGPQPGSELAWAGVFVPDSSDGLIMSQMVAAGSTQYLIFPEVSRADGNIDKFAFTQEQFKRLSALHPLYDATDPDLAPFAKQGGKLILWHGWSDPHISPLNTIAFYHAVGEQLGTSTRDAFARLFLFPGMYHCDGGDGFSQFDVLTPLMSWVEGGSAPDKIIAAQVAEHYPGAEHAMGPPPGAGPGGPGGPPVGGMLPGAMPPGGLGGRFPGGMPPGEMPPPGGMPDRSGPPPGMMMPFAGSGAAPLPSTDAKALRTRPVFPYPLVAHYTGRGSADDAANYVAASGSVTDPASYAWQGSEFFKADSLKFYAVKDGNLITTGSK